MTQIGESFGTKMVSFWQVCLLFWKTDAKIKFRRMLLTNGDDSYERFQFACAEEKYTLFKSVASYCKFFQPLAIHFNDLVLSFPLILNLFHAQWIFVETYTVPSVETKHETSICTCVSTEMTFLKQAVLSIQTNNEKMKC